MGKWSIKDIGLTVATGGTYGAYKAITDPGKAQAEAMGQSALAQQSMAQQGLDYQKETRQMTMDAANPGYEELAAVNRLLETRDKTLKLQEYNIQQEMKLLESVDPALREAGKQAFDLLQGKEAAALAPLRKQRELEQKKMENRLASQLGSGWATSSAGMQALNDFDTQTDQIMNQAQQQTLGSLLGVAANVRPNMNQTVQTMGQTIGGLDQSLLQAQQNIAGRRVNAITGSPVNFGSVIKTAGAAHAGEIAKQQAAGQTMGSLLQIGGTVAGAYVGGPMGAAAGGKVGSTLAGSTSPGGYNQDPSEITSGFNSMKY